MLSLKVEDDELIKRLLARGKDSGRADDKNERLLPIELTNIIIKQLL